MMFQVQIFKLMWKMGTRGCLGPCLVLMGIPSLKQSRPQNRYVHEIQVRLAIDKWIKKPRRRDSKRAENEKVLLKLDQ